MYPVDILYVVSSPDLHCTLQYATSMLEPEAIPMEIDSETHTLYSTCLPCTKLNKLVVPQHLCKVG